MNSKIIAKRVPPMEERSGPRSTVAAAYGITVEQFRDAAVDWLENEGFDAHGNEYETLHDWLTQPHPSYRDDTPWQKGDNTPA